MEKDRVRLTCYEAHETVKKSCNKRDCRLWIRASEHQNCSVIGARTGPKTLQEIGDIFGVTRMRICQIEKLVLDKLSKAIDSAAV
jgi:DNA-directed RNA polymerase sigma subunit (sigma70/sigma32)